MAVETRPQTPGQGTGPTAAAEIFAHSVGQAPSPGVGQFLDGQSAITLSLISLLAFGIYIGRFERWNSWDVVVRPGALLADLPNWFHRGSIKFTLLFSLLLGAAHLMLLTTESLLNRRPETIHEN